MFFYIFVNFLKNQYRNLPYAFSKPNIDFGLLVKFSLAQNEPRIPNIFIS